MHPLPRRKAILDAFIQLGFRFKNADMERGHIRGTRQKLPFYQEIEFLPPQQYRGTEPGRAELRRRRTGHGTSCGDGQEAGSVQRGQRTTFRSFQVGLNDYQGTDWTAYLNQWLSEVGSKRNWF
ncbi:hypothetical protein BJ962_000003 [Streptomyces aureorectus]|nr:hypothetical protein [Streptomyces calvus]